MEVSQPAANQQTGFSGFPAASSNVLEGGPMAMRSGGNPPSPTAPDPQHSKIIVKTDPEGGGGSSGGESEEGWRAYYEHPLTAATNAMLISGEENENPGSVFYYPLQGLPPHEKNDKGFTEIWASVSAASGNVTSGSKLTNGVPELGEGGAAELTLYVKREPDDRSPLDLILQKGPVSVSPRLANGSSSSHVRDGDSTPSPLADHTDSVIVQSSTEPKELVREAADGGMSSSVQPYPNPAVFTVVSSAGYDPPPPPSPLQLQHSGNGGVLTQGPSQQFVSSSGIRTSGGGVYTINQEAPYYRDYYSGEGGLRVNSQLGFSGGDTEGSFVERYIRQNSAYKTPTAVTVDLPSPDSGIGTDAITPRDQSALQPPFEYGELCGNLINSEGTIITRPSGTPTPTPPGAAPRTRPWHDFGRQNDIDKIQIPKVFCNYGFRYHFESPISTSQRREDDRITYINKGQFYGVSMEYVQDPEAPPLKSGIVKSVVMLMFREEKTPEDEIKAWQFWHSRQHSVKQRILDVDSKNSVGLVGCIEEVAHNAIAVYWNPSESPAKINVAVQCLSTDFSSQKGVKGLPLHIQIDTYEDPRERPLVHRGYCQIKVFCDKGAERKTRDEERRAAKRKLTSTGRKKFEELYHPVQERSEFYSMADLSKPPVLFTPSHDIDKLSTMDLQSFYTQTDESQSPVGAELASPHSGDISSPGSVKPTYSPVPPSHPLKFHNIFPPSDTGEKKLSGDHIEASSNGITSDGMYPLKRAKLTPPVSERLMLFVRQDGDEVYTPLHLVPPSTDGLKAAVENKYNIPRTALRHLYRKNRKGVIAKVDDDMLKHYCNEDTFVLELCKIHDDSVELTLIESE